MSHPVLYSLRQCPYAMRARIGVLLANQSVVLRDIVMTNIPTEMLTASPKGTVPVLVLSDSSVIEESLNIMLWALKQNDPDNLLYRHERDALDNMLTLIQRCDNEFVDALKKYKAASRYHDTNIQPCRQQCEIFINDIEENLTKHHFIMGDSASLVDYAILPFIRQFSNVDKKWYKQAPYPKLQQWLENHYQNPIFAKAMTKYPQWLDSNEIVIFGSE